MKREIDANIPMKAKRASIIRGKKRADDALNARADLSPLNLTNERLAEIRAKNFDEEQETLECLQKITNDQKIIQ